MATISEAMQVALRHHRAGRLDQAQEVCRRILAIEPTNSDALHLLGVIARQLGQHGVAVDYIGRAIALNPSVAAYHNSLAVADRALGELDRAVACYRRALELNPDLWQVENDLGNVLQAQGKFDEAVVCYRRALEIKPGFAEAYSNLGNVLQAQGKSDEAAVCCRRAIELKPDMAESHNNLGNALRGQGNLDQAMASYRRALELKADLPEIHNNLANVLRDLGKAAEALACCQQALRLAPDHAESHNNLGNALRDLGKLDEAMACYQRALELKPGLPEAHLNLASALQDQGRFDEAVACCRRALELKPDHAEALTRLGNIFWEQGALEDALAAYQRAFQRNGSFHSNYLTCVQYRPGVTLAGLAAAHAEWDRRYGLPLRATHRQPANDADPDRRLRLGFVSGDFARHPVGDLIVRVLEELRAQDCETFCYSDRTRSDEMTARIASAAGTWRDVVGWSDKRVAERIRGDGVDILFDLAGHTTRNRLLVFARKPAPIQVTWIGYVGTTGLSAMDYVVADRWEVPQGAERYYCEKVLRLPDGYVCYEPPPYAPAVAPLPAQTQGHVTFGSFNNPVKITSAVIAVWAKILRRMPAARLTLKYGGLGHQSTRRRFEALLAAQGVKTSRIDIQGVTSHLELLAEYNRVDLALDPFPYSGGVTTCEALWMGVPVVTCPGETFAGRHALSHLSNVGLTETISGNLDEYVAMAVGLAEDLPRLAAIRGRLRPQMAASPLCDGKRFAVNLMVALRGVWRDWCGR